MSDEILAYVKELGDQIYIQSPVGLYTPESTEIETFAFADEVKRLAPNPKIMWLQGRYVEADKANANGDEWSAGEIALKKLTPTLMPISVMHDLRAAVGTIANTRLRLPSEEADVPRARLETTMALWAHRFPEVAEEAKVNAGQGTLMQSMECIASSYECSICGQLYQYASDRSDKKLWCSHLKGEVDASGTLQKGARRLRSVVFTGTGLIFGTRGARGAYSEAHLEVEALADFHAKARSDKKQKQKSPKPRRRTNVMEIEDKDYQALVAEKSAAEAKVTELTASVQEKDKDLEAAEAAKVKAEEERDKEKTAREAAEETARVAALASERIEALGAGFTAKLAKLEATNKKVQTQAGTLSDDEWNERIAELEETLDVKRDAAADAEDEPQIKKLMSEGKTRAEAEAIVKKSSEEKNENAADETTAGLLFDRSDAAAAEITASTRSTNGAGTAPSKEARRSVVGGLIKPRRPAATGAEK